MAQSHENFVQRGQELSVFLSSGNLKSPGQSTTVKYSLLFLGSGSVTSPEDTSWKRDTRENTCYVLFEGIGNLNLHRKHFQGMCQDHWQVWRPAGKHQGHWMIVYRHNVSTENIGWGQWSTVPNPNWWTVFLRAMILSSVVWLEVSEDTVSPRK